MKLRKLLGLFAVLIVTSGASAQIISLAEALEGKKPITEKSVVTLPTPKSDNEHLYAILCASRSPRFSQATADYIADTLAQAAKPVAAGNEFEARQAAAKQKAEAKVKAKKMLVNAAQIQRVQFDSRMKLGDYDFARGRFKTKHWAKPTPSWDMKTRFIKSVRKPARGYHDLWLISMVWQSGKAAHAHKFDGLIVPEADAQGVLKALPETRELFVRVTAELFVGGALTSYRDGVATSLADYLVLKHISATAVTKEGKAVKGTLNLASGAWQAPKFPTSSSAVHSAAGTVPGSVHPVTNLKAAAEKTFAPFFK